MAKKGTRLPGSDTTSFPINLIIDPAEGVKLSYFPHQSATTELTITNPNHFNLGFKIKTNAPQNYSVKPREAILLPQHKLVLRIKMTEEDISSSELSKHRFLVLYQKVDLKHTELYRLKNTWENSNVRKKKIKIQHNLQEGKDVERDTQIVMKEEYFDEKSNTQKDIILGGMEIAKSQNDGGIGEIEVKRDRVLSYQEEELARGFYSVDYHGRNQKWGELSLKIRACALNFYKELGRKEKLLKQKSVVKEIDDKLRQRVLVGYNMIHVFVVALVFALIGCLIAPRA